MADLSLMQVRALVDETDIGQIQPGQTANVTVEAYPGRRFTGRVQKIEPQAVVDQNVTMFPVMIDLANPEGLLKSGMNADVSVQVARHPDVVAVPNGAVSSMRDAASTASALGIDPSALRAQRPSGGARGSRPGSGGAPAAGTQSAVVFVKGPDGPEPRRVVLGMSDWSYTEVESGLRAGDTVYEVTGAQLQAQQTQMQDNIRQRAGGMIPGAGGGRRGG
jgi:HlyD family secretion protein